MAALWVWEVRASATYPLPPHRVFSVYSLKAICVNPSPSNGLGEGPWDL
jgi:hypothetical protein